MWTHVKGVDMVMTSAIWTKIKGLKHFRAKVGKGNIGSTEDYNKIQFFKYCLRNPHVVMKGFHVG